MNRLLKSELKAIAIENGLGRRYNGRPISKMRKRDFIDFLLERDFEPEVVEILEVPEVRNLASQLSEANKKIDTLTELLESLTISTPPKQETATEETQIPSLQCPVCLTNKINTVLECTHVICSICLKQLDKCPICRADIINDVTYFRI